MSDPLEQLCPDCGRNALACEVLLAVKAGLSGFDVHARLGCSEAAVARLRASLTTAEKEIARQAQEIAVRRRDTERLSLAHQKVCGERDEAKKEHRLCAGKLISAAGRIVNAEEDADTAERKLRADSSALEKALGALRAAVGMLQECVVAIGASEYEYTSDDTRAMLLMAKVVDWLTLNEASGGAHVDALKGMK